MKKIMILVSLLLAACSTAPSPSTIQTAIAGTLAAAPVQVIQVTQIVQLTHLVEIPITDTPAAMVDETATPTLEATPTPTDTATLANTPLPGLAGTPTPTVTQTANLTPGAPLGLTLPYFINSYVAMTDLQKSEYLPTVQRRTVFWSAQVSNVTADGLVLLKFPEPLVGTITLVGIPKKTALTIPKEYWIDFTGTIQEFTEDLNLRLVITDVKIKAIYIPPTPTPTPAPRFGH